MSAGEDQVRDFASGDVGSNDDSLWSHWIVWGEVLVLILALVPAWYFENREVSRTAGAVIVCSFLLLALYFAVVSPWLIHRDNLASLGLGPWGQLTIRKDNLQASVVEYGRISLALGIAILFAALLRGNEHLRTFSIEQTVTKFLAYLVSASVQDYLAFAWGTRRIGDLYRAVRLLAVRADRGPHRALSRNLTRQHELATVRITVATALVFALGHLPNLPLMLVALVWASLIVPAWRRTPNLWVLVVCHATLGTLLHRVLGLNMRVGPGYLNPSSHFLRKLLPLLSDFMGSVP